jgi:hypothetical protein
VVSWKITSGLAVREHGNIDLCNTGTVKQKDVCVKQNDCYSNTASSILPCQVNLNVQ